MEPELIRDVGRSIVAQSLRPSGLRSHLYGTACASAVMAASCGPVPSMPRVEYALTSFRQSLYAAARIEVRY
jgi:hypothetical protein